MTPELVAGLEGRAWVLRPDGTRRAECAIRQVGTVEVPNLSQASAASSGASVSVLQCRRECCFACHENSPERNNGTTAPDRLQYRESPLGKFLFHGCRITRSRLIPDPFITGSRVLVGDPVARRRRSDFGLRHQWNHGRPSAWKRTGDSSAYSRATLFLLSGPPCEAPGKLPAVLGPAVTRRDALASRTIRPM
jgi:hypothetical protein